MADNEFDFSHLGAKKKNEFDFSHLAGEVDLSKLPFPLNIGIGLGVSAAQPLKKTIPERLQAVPQGLRESFQGVGQLYQGGKEALGLSPSGTADKYTQSVVNQRKQFKEGQKTFDPLSDYLRKSIASWPEGAASLVPFVGESTLLPRMLKGGAAMGAAKGAEFTPFEDERPMNIAKGTAIGSLLPVVPEAPRLAEEGLSWLMGKQNPLLTEKRNALKQNISKASKELGELGEAKSSADIAHQENKLAYGEAQDVAQGNNIPRTPAAIKAKVNTHLENIDASKRQAEELTQELNTLEPPKPLNLTYGHVEQAQNAAQEFNRATQNVSVAEQQHAQAKNLLNKSEEKIAQHLNKDETHDVLIGSDLKKAYEDIHEEAKEDFGKLNENLAKSKYKIPNIKEYNAKKKALLKGSKDNPYVKAMIKEYPGEKDSMASDFITKHQDARDYRYHLTQKLKDKNLTFKEKKQIREALSLTKPLNDLVKQTLNAGLGEHKDEWLRLNKIYSDVLHPLSDQPLMKKALKSRPLGENVLHAMRGDSQGASVLRAIAKKNPETLKNLLGQRYEKNATKVHQPNKLTEEFMNEMPELKQHVAERNQAHEAVQHHEANLALAKEKLAAAKEKVGAAAKVSKKAETEITRLVNKHKEDYEKYETDKAKFESDISGHHEKISSLEKNIEKLEKEKEVLQANRSKVKQSLEDKTQAERKYAAKNREITEHKRQLSETKEKLEKASTGLHYLYVKGKQLGRMIKSSM